MEVIHQLRYITESIGQASAKAISVLSPYSAFTEVILGKRRKGGAHKRDFGQCGAPSAIGLQGANFSARGNSIVIKRVQPDIMCKKSVFPFFPFPSCQRRWVFNKEESRSSISLPAECDLPK